MEYIPDFLKRMEGLYSPAQIKRLGESHVWVAGLGGVGSYAAEALARAGIGKFTLIDGDHVEITNINRQLLALHSTLGKSKAHLMAERVADINPKAEIQIIDRFLTPDEWEELMENKPDYILDAIDSLTPKVYLLATAKRRNIPLISVLGTGGKKDPSLIRIADLFHTRNDYLARMVRKRLRKHGIREGISAVYSPEKPDKKALLYTEGSDYKKSAYGTVSYIPAIFGLTAASVVINDLAGEAE